MRVIIATGTGRYADPWHPFEATSQLVAECLRRDLGAEVSVDTDVDHALARAAEFDLVIVNAGDPWRDEDRSLQPAADSASGLGAAIESGTGFLALHAAVASLRDYPDWARLTGAIWLPQISWHPPKGELIISPAERPGGPGLLSEEFGVVDELYLRMQQVGDRAVVAEADHEGVSYPVVWTRTCGRSRAVVDVLGHGPESYESAGHRQLLTTMAQWAARE